MKIKVSFILIFCCIALFSNAQLNNAELDSKLEQAKKTMGNNFAALIYKDGKIVYKKKVGEYFDEKAQVEISGSSRWLTTALVLQFIEEGKLSLDSKIADYLPIYVTYGKKYITIRHCLTDLVGIENKKTDITEVGKFNTLEELVNDYAKKEIRANAGTDFWYGGIGINIAARVVEVISKKSFEQLITQRLLRPLAMKNTSFSPTNNRCINPAGGAVSTASDYINFLAMLLNKGMFNGKQILSAASVEQLQVAQVDKKIIASQPKGSENFSFSLGGCIQAKTEDDKASVIGCPSFTGIWPFVDLCRGYACIILPKFFQADSRKEIYTSFKNLIDDQLTSTCK
jgi:CubicO group peptidase (beta-lactamase class C family)